MGIKITITQSTIAEWNLQQKSINMILDQVKPVLADNAKNNRINWLDAIKGVVDTVDLRRNILRQLQDSPHHVLEIEGWMPGRKNRRL